SPGLDLSRLPSALAGWRPNVTLVTQGPIGCAMVDGVHRKPGQRCSSQAWASVPGSPMRRRDFITLVGGACVAPFGAYAQTPKVPVIGFLNTASPKPFAQLVAAFQKSLGEAGFIDGQNVTIEYRWAEGDENRLKQQASDLVQRHVALIAATG